MADVKQDMLPDSTQGETPDQKKGTKRKGSKDGKKKKKVAKRKSKITGKRKTKSSPGSDVDSDLDLSKEKQPLEFYLHDREELINEAFIAVTGLQLTNMVPDILKYVPLDELKRLCLNQLEGLSRKRIRHIIQGTEMLSSSDSDESAPEDEVGDVTMTTTSVQADVTVNTEGEKKDGAEMETCVDSTIVPLTNTHPDSQKVGVESKAEDIDGVPVEVDVNIEELAFGKSGAQPGSRAVKTSSGDGVSNTAAKPSKDTSKTKSKGSTEKHSQVSSTHQRSTSRSPRRRRRSWSSRSHSRGRYSRSRSRSRRRSWSRSRSRSRSWSRSWSRSRSRSRTRSRSPGRKEALPVDPPLPPSPPPPPPHVDAIQMRYPTPPTPSGSLSSGEIREILELESEEDEEEEEKEALEDRRCREQEMRRKLEGLVGGRKGLEHKVSGKMTGKLEDAAAPPGVDDADDMVVQRQSGPAESISSISQSCEDVAAGNEEAETRGKAGTYPGKMSCEEDDDEEEDDSDDDSDDSDDGDDDSEEDDDDDDDDDINLDSLDLGVDMSKAAGQPSQLALARASIKSPLTSNAAEEQKDSGEAELEVLELELRARAIRSLMHKCLKEDDKT
ncbi:uncharacterized protein DDB_G0284459-like [Strongylocentrotus purpuratus]|uniref:Uncharacterized protein n=1 Tax=Strongylocentrotus purpuratus TaxID=7668 RepID=A0A7M7PL09_STRPU|nr:uncharacterized protein DDB_G0284459-like [Strongylocentrotus purpuratus]